MTCEGMIQYFKLLYQYYESKGEILPSKASGCEYLQIVNQDDDEVKVFYCFIRDTCLPPSTVYRCIKLHRECPIRIEFEKFQGRRAS